MNWPLIAAIKHCQWSKVLALIQHGADVDTPATECGETALMVACAQNAPAHVVAALIDYGADVNKAQQNGATPLCIAAQNGHEPVVVRLLGAGADTDKATHGGATPLFLSLIHI